MGWYGGWGGVMGGLVWWVGWYGGWVGMVGGLVWWVGWYGGWVGMVGGVVWWVGWYGGWSGMEREGCGRVKKKPDVRKLTWKMRHVTCQGGIYTTLDIT